MIRANVVTTSKYRMDFHPIRPTCFGLEWYGNTYHRVENNKGATMVFTSRKKIVLRNLSFVKGGKIEAISTPIAIATNIRVVSDLLSQQIVPKQHGIHRLTNSIFRGPLSNVPNE